jgi:predicted kinase
VSGKGLVCTDFLLSQITHSDLFENRAAHSKFYRVSVMSARGGVGKFLRGLKRSRDESDDVGVTTSVEDASTGAASAKQVQTVASGRPMPAKRRIEVVVLIGISGSGKSAFATETYGSHAIVARKFMRPRKNFTRDRKEAMVIETRMQEGRNMVIDAPHLRTQEREQLLQTIAAKAELVGVQARVTGVVFRSNEKLCAERNEARRDSTRLLSQDRLKAQRRALQWPSSGEAFDELLYAKEKHATATRPTWELLPYVPHAHRLFESDSDVSDDHDRTTTQTAEGVLQSDDDLGD